MDNASKFAVVVLWVVSNADPLGKKARVVWEVKCAGRKRPCRRMLVMLPTGPVWQALMCATSLSVEVARETGGGEGWVALVLRYGSDMALYWN